MLGYAIISALKSLFSIIELLIIANAILSWVPMFTQNVTVAKIYGMVNYLVEPVLKPIRKLLSKTPIGNMPIDISPIIAILLLGFLQNILIIVVVTVI